MAMADDAKPTGVQKPTPTQGGPVDIKPATQSPEVSAAPKVSTDAKTVNGPAGSIETGNETTAPSMPKADPKASIEKKANPDAPNASSKPANSENKATPSAATPGAPSANPSKAKTESGKNVFTELFGDDKSQKNAKLMGTVVAQQDKKKKSLFGKGGSKLKTIKDKGKKSFKVSKSTPGKLVLQVSILLLVGVGAFFYTQNIASFELLGTNPAQRVEIAEENLAQENAEISVQKYLSAALLLDQFSNAADEYLYNTSQAESSYTSQNKKTAYESAAEDLMPEIENLLQRIAGYLDDNMDNEERSTAKIVVEDLTNELREKSGEVDEETLLQDIQDLENAKMLMQSKNFRDSVAAIDLDNISHEDIESVYNGYSDISASVTAIIASIKDARVMWSEYLEDLEDLTKTVDPLFNTEFTGNLALDTVKFSTDGSVNVSGESITDDTKNFTLISNLIDIYEASTSFENVEDRSYSKSASNEDSYMGQFRITMDLENYLTESE